MEQVSDERKQDDREATMAAQRKAGGGDETAESRAGDHYGERSEEGAGSITASGEHALQTGWSFW